MVTVLNVLVLSVGMLSIVTNGVLLFIILQDPLRCFRKRSTTYFIISLAVADLLTGAFEFFMEMRNMYPFHSTDLEKYTYPVSWITTQVSFLTLLAMSVERFLIVKYPFDSRRWITKKRICASIAAIWLISTILGALILLPHPQLAYVQFAIFVEFLLSIILIVGFYAFILLRVKKSTKTLEDANEMRNMLPNPPSPRKRKFNRESAVTDSGATVVGSVRVSTVPVANGTDLLTVATESLTVGPGSVGIGNDSVKLTSIETNGEGAPLDKCSRNGSSKHTRCSRHGNETPELCVRREQMTERPPAACNVNKRLSNMARRNNQQEKKLTAVVLLLVGVLIVTVLPYLFATQIYVGYSIFCGCPPMSGLMKFMYIYYPIELLNFAVNPLIYAWRLPQYRRTLAHICTRRHRAGGNSHGLTL